MRHLLAIAGFLVLQYDKITEKSHFSGLNVKENVHNQLISR